MEIAVNFKLQSLYPGKIAWWALKRRLSGPQIWRKVYLEELEITDPHQSSN
jgi:hypothetical protein